jgi:acyl-coenzyme A synthetase/AMP-(fatty) acid ligase
MRAPRKPQTTAGFLALHAQQRPDSVAIEAVDGRTLYHDLAQMVLQARDLLIGAGIERGQVLGVFIPDRRSHLIVLLAAETLGITTFSLIASEIGAPIHLDLLCDRLLMSEPVAAADPEKTIWAKTIWAKTIWLRPETLTRPEREQPFDALDDRPDPETVVRLIKSSGTTGLPKVMTMTHRVQVLTLLNILRYAAPLIKPHPHYLCLYNFSIRGAHSRALLTLQMGGVIHLTGGNVIGDMIATGVGNFVLFVTGDLERFVRAPRQDLFRPDLHIDVIGSAVSPRLRQAVQSRITPHVAVTYGTNEVHHVSIVDEANVGTLFPGVRIRIVDESGKPVAQGESGLIRIRTGTMTNGYVNAPEQTKAAFVKGWYLTNDIGYQPAPDTLVVLGRADDMVIVGGIKIAPDPIEAGLKAIAGIRDALVMSIDDQLDTGFMLVAVEIEPGLLPGDLAGQVAQIVNPYVSGFQFLPVTAFPRTETGKIRREAVKALYRDSVSRM